MKGKKVTTLKQLAELARNKRSVICENRWGSLPAIVVINMTGPTILGAIKSGLYVYEKETK